MLFIVQVSRYKDIKYWLTVVSNSQILHMRHIFHILEIVAKRLEHHDHSLGRRHECDVYNMKFKVILIANWRGELILGVKLHDHRQ